MVGLDHVQMPEFRRILAISVDLADALVFNPNTGLMLCLAE